MDIWTNRTYANFMQGYNVPENTYCLVLCKFNQAARGQIPDRVLQVSQVNGGDDLVVPCDGRYYEILCYRRSYDGKSYVIGGKGAERKPAKKEKVRAKQNKKEKVIYFWWSASEVIAVTFVRYVRMRRNTGGKDTNKIDVGVLVKSSSYPPYDGRVRQFKINPYTPIYKTYQSARLRRNAIKKPMLSQIEQFGKAIDMWISGGTKKSEVSKFLKAASEKDKKYNYAAKKIDSKVGKIWQVYVSEKA